MVINISASVSAHVPRVSGIPGNICIHAAGACTDVNR